ncbi:S8 family peptidase [Rubrivivax sp. A210]|uniref:S8 family peptidase n=1 Tax=Rubrivivax sp. A210 TaxID=2772301 RepID=UPI001917E799|nr:S8 family peptidase [Rubrivivax sp. A210]
MRLASIAAAIAAFGLPAAALAGSSGPSGAGFGQAGARAQSDRLIIKYRDGTTAQARADLQTMSDAHAQVNRAGFQMNPLRRDARGAHVMKLDRRVDEAQLALLARQIAAHPDVEYAEPDRLMQIQLTPNDPSYLAQWHYYEAVGGLNAPTAWDASTGTGVVVAVLDTGYRPHVDLAANIVAGMDMIIDTAVSNDGNGRDTSALDPGDWTVAGECGAGSGASSSSWHGTHVAGTIAAVTNNAAGVAGVAFGAKVQPVRVLGKCGGYTSDIADGIIWASGGTVAGLAANATPARVISLSLGGGGACDVTTQNAINSARSRGTVVVVAAGNSNANAANFSPASCAGVVTVAATSRTGGRASYSNFGALVDVAAPGGQMTVAGDPNGILSTLNSGTTVPGADTYAYYQGTSMATPHVSAVAALMLAANPALTPDQVESLLKSTARPFPATCSQCGTGIVNAAAAVAAATGNPPPPPPPPPPTTTVAEVEPNNSRSAAQLITPNPATVNGRIASTSDNDYYRVSLGAGKTLAAALTPPATADYDLYVYNANGTQIASSTLGTGAVDSASVRNSGTTAATVYVRVRYFSGGAGNYQLRLSQ